jgi:hypothetical protein
MGDHTIVVCNDLESLFSAHKNADLLVLFVLHDLDFTNSTLLPCTSIETIQLSSPGKVDKGWGNREDQMEVRTPTWMLGNNPMEQKM